MTIEERNQIVTDNQNFVRHILKQFLGKHNGAYNYDDLLQVANIAFIKALDRYDPKLAPNWTTYAGAIIKGYVQYYIYRNAMAVHVSEQMYYSKKPLPFKEIPLDKIVEGSDGETKDTVKSVLDFQADPNDQYAVKDILLAVEKICAGNKRNYDIWFMKHVLGYSQRTIADQYGISPAAISHIIIHINNELRRDIYGKK